MEKAWYTKKWMTVCIHAAAWIVLFSLPELLRQSHNAHDVNTPRPGSPTVMFIISLINYAWLIAFFYLNALVLIPRLLYKRKYLIYIFSLVSYFAVYVVALWALWKNFTKMDFTFEAHTVVSMFIFVFILACSVAYKTIGDKLTEDRLAKEKETEHLKTELSLLRSQASPHFMFNVLNNMVALARKHSEELEPSLIKFSSLMRYMLYETDEEKVSLESEAEYLQSYIDLQQQRLSKRAVVAVNICKGDKPYEIDPMLLIPFVENAFKHGTGFIENPRIDIDLKAKNDILYFRVSNTYDPTSQQVKDKASGIGLANVRRRLDLLHTGQYTLDITKENSVFTVSLQINLS
ncbi:MAG TPA: histidine kinase [Hanamia sp.]|nr:histidine kinase [Hanamia sp.]